MNNIAAVLWFFGWIWYAVKTKEMGEPIVKTWQDKAYFCLGWLGGFIYFLSK